MEAIELISQRLETIEMDLRELRENHIHDVELRLERIDTTLKIGWKVLVFGAGLPAFLSAGLSLIQVLK